MAHAETAETGCSGDPAPCNGSRDRGEHDLQEHGGQGGFPESPGAAVRAMGACWSSLGFDQSGGDPGPLEGVLIEELDPA